MKKKLMILGLATAGILASAGSCDRLQPPTDTLNCDDFETHEQAQAAYEQARTQENVDPHNLDDNNDGVACDHLREGEPSATPEAD